MLGFYVASKAVTVVARVVANLTFMNLKFTLILFTLSQLLFFCQVTDFDMTIQLVGGPQNDVTISAVKPLQQVDHLNM